MNNEPAFPTYHGGYSKCDTNGCGMTLRDYFAAQAMHALITHEQGLATQRDLLAAGAYAYADAMLRKRGEQS